MPTTSDLPAISNAIQLAIAPVFLLTGIASLLGVVTNRLGRVIDRARALELVWPGLSPQARKDARGELARLERRRGLASWSINFCTAAALLVCVVIVTLFVGEFFGRNLSLPAGALFVVAMLTVIGGLYAFLREVYIASHSTSIDARRFDAAPDP